MIDEFVDQTTEALLQLPPGMLIILGALLIPIFRGRWKQGWMISLPLISFGHLWLTAQQGSVLTLELFDQLNLTPIRIDKLSLVWGYIFHFATLIAVLFSLQVRSNVQHVAALLYAGAAIAAVFAGDLLTLFMYWELTAIASVFLVWAGQTKASYGAGLRYLILQVMSGVLLLAGTIFHYQQSGSLDFVGAGGVFKLEDGMGAWLILIAFGIKAAFPLVHCWLPDSYPAASPTGTVFLSIFTTKLAIYCLARGFAGTEPLIVVGAVMAIYPLIYAVLEDDLRRVLAYSLINQLGFMVIAIGVGTEKAISGTAGHAVSHILYKGLLFMAVGAVVSRTGTGSACQLGGLLKRMPWTAAFCMIGALGMSAPLFGGFVTKSLILSATKYDHEYIWMLLVLASAGVFFASGIKVCWAMFFGEQHVDDVEDAPLNMRIAMGLAAGMLIFLGLAPNQLFKILPYAVDYQVYTLDHIITQIQLLTFTGLAFLILSSLAIYPATSPVTYLDVDWLYRRLLPGICLAGFQVIRGVQEWFASVFGKGFRTTLGQLERCFSESGPMGKARPTGWMATWAAILLAGYLLLYYEEEVSRFRENTSPEANVQEHTSDGGAIFASQPDVD